LYGIFFNFLKSAQILRFLIPFKHFLQTLKSDTEEMAQKKNIFYK